jgi:aryl-alcohol dehydrogenase-like predicted oxidoreductase
MPLEYRELGDTGEKVSVIGVGCWAAGGYGWGGADDAQSTEAFAAAIDLGINLFDTAPIYGFGHAERVLAPVLKGRRDRVFLATKFGLAWREENAKGIYNDLKPQSIRAECDASLTRLGVDHIDLYQCHWPLQNGAMTQTVTDDMVATLHALRDAGKIRYWGVSNFSVEQIERMGAGGKPASHQPPLSILRPKASFEEIPWCADKRIGVLCYSPMFRGLLTGKYRGDEVFPEGDGRRNHPDHTGERFRDICNRVQTLRDVADRHNTTIAGVALGWVLSTPGVTVALAGTRNRDQITEVAQNAHCRLSAEEREEITARFGDYVRR